MAPEQVTGERRRRPERPVRRGRDPVRDARRPAGVQRPDRRSRSCTRRCYEQPPALTGSPAVAAVDRVIRRALAKRPADRPASAEAMAEELRAIRGVRERRHAGPGARAHPARRPAVPRPAARSRNGLPRLQPAGRDRHVALGHRVADRALERRRRAIRRGDARPQGARRRSRRRPRGHGHAAALGRSAAGCGAARRGAGRHAADVAHGPVVAGRSVPAAGRHRAARRRRRSPLPLAGGTTAPTPDAPHDAARLRALSAGERARAHLRRASRRARPVRALPRAGPALRARVGAPRPLPSRDRQVHRRRARQRGARRGGVPPRARAQPAALDRAQVLREPRGGHRPGASARSCACSARPAATATIRSSSPGSSTPAATADCSNSRSPRTPRRAGSIRTCPTSVEQTLLMTGDIDRLLGHRASAHGRRRRRWHPGHRAGAGRTSRRGAPQAARDAPGRRASRSSRLDRIPDGLARSPSGGHGRPACPRSARSRSTTIRRRSSRRAGCCATSASTRPGSRYLQRAVAKGYFVAADAVGQPAVRRAAERSRFPRAAGRRRKPAGSRRSPRSARPAASGCSAVTDRA